MKKTALFLIVLFALPALACSGLTIQLGNSNNGETLRVVGSGDLIEETREVSDFDKIVFNTVGELRITQGDSESLMVEAEENIMPRIVTEVRGSTLYIETERGISLDINRNVTFTLTLRELSGIELNGLGDIDVSDLVTESLDLQVNGAGGIEIDELTADSLEARMNGLGSVTVEGEVDRQTISIPGSGNFNGEDLRSNTANVKIDGLGNANVWVIEDLDVEINGAGNVNYYGDPQVSEDINGLGRVHHEGNR